MSRAHRNQSPLELDDEVARSRNIKPGFFDDEGLAELGAECMVLFAGLWTLADREGRLEDRPKRIKARVLPYFDVDVGVLLAGLHEHGFIVRYEVDGQQYIQVTNFGKHQTPHIKEAASTIPAPDKHGANTGAAPPDSLNRIPDTGFLIPDSPLSDSDAPAAPDPEWMTSFNEFWAMYPKGRGNKRQAAQQWTKLRVSERRAALAALPAFVACEQWQKEGGRYVRHAERWLRDRGWEDDVPPDVPARASPGGKRSVADEFAELTRKFQQQEQHSERVGNESGAYDARFSVSPVPTLGPGHREDP